MMCRLSLRLLEFILLAFFCLCWRMASVPELFGLLANALSSYTKWISMFPFFVSVAHLQQRYFLDVYKFGMFIGSTTSYSTNVYLEAIVWFETNLEVFPKFSEHLSAVGIDISADQI